MQAPRGPGMGWQHKRAHLRDLLQGGQHDAQHLRVVHVRRPVQRDQAVPAGFEPEPGQDVALERTVEVGEQGVHHDVAHQVDLVVAVSFGPQVANRVGRGAKR